jgi:hypothetical protein
MAADVIDWAGRRRKEEEEKEDIYTPAHRYLVKIRTGTYRSLRYQVESSPGTLGRALGTG